MGTGLEGMWVPSPGNPASGHCLGPHPASGHGTPGGPGRPPGGTSGYLGTARDPEGKEGPLVQELSHPSLSPACPHSALARASTAHAASLRAPLSPSSFFSAAHPGPLLGPPHLPIPRLSLQIRCSSGLVPSPVLHLPSRHRGPPRSAGWKLHTETIGHELPDLEGRTQPHQSGPQHWLLEASDEEGVAPQTPPTLNGHQVPASPGSHSSPRPHSPPPMLPSAATRVLPQYTSVGVTLQFKSPRLLKPPYNCSSSSVRYPFAPADAKHPLSSAVYTLWSLCLNHSFPPNSYTFFG